jgi:hypothetical protein
LTGLIGRDNVSVVSVSPSSRWRKLAALFVGSRRTPAVTPHFTAVLASASVLASVLVLASVSVLVSALLLASALVAAWVCR